jgi:hypothetical protein
MGHGAIQFWILNFKFWIKFQSKIQNLKSKILALPTPHSQSILFLQLTGKERNGLEIAW